MKGGEQLFLVLFGNSDALVNNGADEIAPILLENKFDGCTGFRILHGIAQEIRENMTEQTLVRVRIGCEWLDGQIDSAAAMAGRKNFVHKSAAKSPDVQRRGLKIQSSGVESAEHEDLFHHTSH